MLDRLKNLSFALVRRLLLWMTEPSALGTETLPPHLRVVYVLNNRSLTDLVMLDIVDRREQSAAAARGAHRSGHSGTPSVLLSESARAAFCYVAI